MKSKLRALVLKVVFIYATLFPSSGLIQDLGDYTSKAPEDMDDYMFI